MYRWSVRVFKHSHPAFDPSHVSCCLTSQSVMSCRCVIHVLHYEAERRKHMSSDLLNLVHDNMSREWKCHLSGLFVCVCVWQYICWWWQNKWQFSDDFIASLNSLKKSNLGSLCISFWQQHAPIFPNAHLLLAGKQTETRFYFVIFITFTWEDKLFWSFQIGHLE